jgi:beta-glucosidase
MIFNEPNVFTIVGYGYGAHAPGKTDFDLAMRAAHVVNLAQGDAFRAVRAEIPRARIGSAFTMSTFEPATPSTADRDAARRWQAFWNSWFVDPALRGRYPEAFPGAIPLDTMAVKPGDMERTKIPLDFLGLNHYNRFVVTAAGDGQGGIPGSFGPGPDGPRTDMDWEVWPKGFSDVVLWITQEYSRPQIEITENGCAYADGPDATGRVRDTRRIDFYRGYLRALAGAIAAGADVRGYHAWSLLDNFEWAEGYTQRFGLIHVDFKTLKRTLKDSGDWYRQVIAANAV